ncbi:MAG: glycosyltransferase [Vicingaceae bacterium]|nr:glycosyltransferase [Vicingaceae bacterium]
MKNKKNILVITSWSYNDALIQTYTLPYLNIIANHLSDDSKIFLTTLEKNNQSINNNYHKIKNILIEYHPLSLKGLLMWIKLIFKLLKTIRKEKIDVIHCWCTPAGMIGYILSLLTRRSLIIDSYEPHAETMVENGVWKKNGMVYRLLFFFEKRLTKRAKYLIATTEGMKSYAKEKYNFQGSNIFVKPACVNLNLFSEANLKNNTLVEELKLQDKIVGVYAGKFGGIYLEKEVFDFLKEAENYWGDKFRALILSAHTKQEISTYATKSEINPKTIVHRFVAHHEIPNYMGLGDFGITPVKPIPTKRYCTPIKDGEYWALGLPVVITKDISDDSDIIKKYGIGSVLEELNEDNYLKAVKEIDELLSNNSREEIYQKIRPIAEKYRNFEIAEKIYAAIYGK